MRVSSEVGVVEEQVTKVQCSERQNLDGRRAVVEMLRSDIETMMAQVLFDVV